mmetsp:Transcript_8964/g.15568  ORF Transcript_8964/g.15568 Transcript_8964/m.15568 type:complete len:406 (+) Transcript_8964:3-1220(+)
MMRSLTHPITAPATPLGLTCSRRPRLISFPAPAPQLPRISSRLRSSRGEGEPEEAGKDTSQPDEQSEPRLNLPVAGVDTDWRAYRAKLIASSKASESSVEKGVRDLPDSTADALWAHKLSRAETGSLLLAHPVMFSAGTQKYFHMAVILLLEVGPKGAYGVIINQESNLTLAQLSLNTALDSCWDESTLWVGGDCGGGEVTLLHAVPGLEGSTEVVRGLYTGGVMAAQEAVKSGKAKAADFRWICKSCGWGPGQLESEISRGVWFPSAASPAVVLTQFQGPEGKADAWHTILQLMGGDHAALSTNVKAAQEKLERRAMFELLMADAAADAKRASEEAGMDRGSEATQPTATGGIIDISSSTEAPTPTATGGNIDSSSSTEATKPTATGGNTDSSSSSTDDSSTPQ